MTQPGTKNVRRGSWRLNCSTKRGMAIWAVARPGLRRDQIVCRVLVVPVEGAVGVHVPGHGDCTTRAARPRNRIGDHPALLAQYPRAGSTTLTNGSPPISRAALAN